MGMRSGLQRAGRRLVAYPRVRAAAVAVGRRFPAAKQLGRRVLGIRAGSERFGSGGARIDIRGGLMTLAAQSRTWPIVVFAALDLSPGDTEVVADAVERAQLTSGRFKPLFLVDSGELAPFRVRNYAVETVMAERMYTLVNPQDSYPEYVYERTESIAAAYGVRAVVPLSIEALRAQPTTYLLRLVGALTI